MIDSLDLKRKIANRLTEIGKSKGLKTRNQRAAVLDVTPRCLSNWENAQRMPGLEELFKISEKYDVPLPYIICWDDNLDAVKVNLNRPLIAKVMISEIIQ